MIDGQPWSVRGVAPEIRDDALNAAHAAGMTLGQWLNGVIRDSLTDLRAARSHPMRDARYGRRTEGQDAPTASPVSPGSTFQQEMARPIMTPYPAQQPYPYASVPPYAQPPVPPYAMPQPGYAPVYPPYGAPMDPIEARLRHYAQMGAETAVGAVQGSDPRLLSVIDAAVGAMQTSVKSSEKKTAAALDALTTLIERQRTSDLNRHIQRSGGQSHAAGLDVEASPVAQVNTVLASLVERLNSLEQSLSAAHGARGAATTSDARQIEDRVGEALEALSREIARPAGIMEAAQPRPPRTGLRPRITVPRGGSNAAVAEIEARQRWLDATPRPANGPETAALEAIRKSVAALADQVRETRRQQDTLPETDLRAELQALQRAVADLAPRQSVASLGEAIRGLATKVDQSRQDGVRESSLAPIERLLGDMRVALEEMRNPRGFEAINTTLSQLSRRIETLGERSGDGAHLGDIQRQMNDIRAAISDARPAAAFDGLHQQIRSLSAKLDDLAERPRDTRVMSLLTDAVEDVRDNLKRIDPEAVAERIERRLAGLDGLEDRIERLTQQMSTQGQGASTAGIESLEARIEQLADRLAKQSAGSKTKGIEGLEARLDKLTDRLAAAAASGIVPAAAGFTGLEGIEARLDRLDERLAAESPGALDGLTQRIEAMTKALSKRGGEPDLSPIVKRIDEVREALARQKGGDLTSIEQRIADLQHALEKRGGEPDIKSLEQILRKLAEKIESARAPDASLASLDDLQRQMAQLAERLDRATPGHPALGGLERTLSDLCQKVANLQDSAGGGLGGAPMDTLAAEGMVLIKRDLTEMKTAQAEADSRSREVLQHVNATLEKIVGRLSSLEGDIASGRMSPPRQSVAASAVPPPSLPQPPTTAPTAAIANVGRSAPVLAKPIEVPVERKSRAEAATAPQPVTTPVRTPLAAAASAGPMDFDADLPLEPGAGRSGRPEPAMADAAPAGDDPRANFIAAARRAAQAAAAQTSAAISEAEAKGGRQAKAHGEGSRLDGVKAVIAARRKPILLGVAALLVLISGLKVMSTFMGDKPQMPKVSAVMPEPAPATEPPAQDTAPAKHSMAPVIEPQKGDPVTVGSVGMPPITAGAAPPPREMVQQPLPTQQDAALVPAEPVSDVAGLIKSTSFTVPDRLKQLASNGNLSAIYEVGARLAEGRDTLRDQKAAAQWIEFAANQGFAPAQYRLGSFNREGIGVPKDSKKAFGWFQKAAQQGNILAMHNLAVLYAEGVMGAPDYAAAAQWFRNAAEHGVKDSQFNIAILNVRGLGVAQDLNEAYKWFSAAARQGDADAAKKRDEIAGRLTADKLAEAKAVAETFQARRPEPRVNELSIPEGGWEGAAKFPSAAMNKKGKS